MIYKLSPIFFKGENIMNFPYDSYFSIHFSVGSCSLEEEKATCYTAAAALAYLTTPILSSPCYSLCFFSVFFGRTKEEQHDRKKNVYKLAKTAGCLILFFVTYFLFHWILLYVLSNLAFTFVQSKVVSEDYRLFFVKSTYYVAS